MEYPFQYQGFENRRLAVETAGWFSPAKVRMDGVEVLKDPQTGAYTLVDNQGVAVEARLRTGLFMDPVPRLEIDGQKISLAQPFKWYEWVLAALPLVLIGIGGALGGLLGAIGVGINGRILRSNRGGMARYLLPILVSLVVAGVYFVGAWGVRLALSGELFSTPQTFTSDAGGFSVTTPVTLQEDVQTLDSHGGPIEVHMFSGQRGELAYMVGYTDYPPDMVAQSDPVSILNGSREGALANTNGQLISEAEVSVGGYPGRELVIAGVTGGQMTFNLHARFYLVNSRLYQVMVVLPEGETFDGEKQAFLDSFALLNR